MERKQKQKRCVIGSEPHGVGSRSSLASNDPARSEAQPRSATSRTPRTAVIEPASCVTHRAVNLISAAAAVAHRKRRRAMPARCSSTSPSRAAFSSEPDLAHESGRGDAAGAVVGSRLAEPERIAGFALRAAVAVPVLVVIVVIVAVQLGPSS